MIEMSEMQWQSIETAPRDGTRILMFAGNGILGTSNLSYTGEWSEKWQCFKSDLMNDCHPTHWMPLPPAPKKDD
jgi:hypothetical protein